VLLGEHTVEQCGFARSEETSENGDWNAITYNFATLPERTRVRNGLMKNSVMPLVVSLGSKVE
jgi:hypothetical protein